MNATLGRVPTSAYRARVATKRRSPSTQPKRRIATSVKSREPVKAAPARERIGPAWNDDIAGQVAEQLDAESRWLREARASTDAASKQAIVVEWLMYLGHPHSGALRERFAHRLAGVSDGTLVRVQTLVQIACDALLKNDHHALDALAATADRLTGRGSEQERIAWALEICEWAIRAAVAGEIEENESRWVAFRVVGAYGELARDGIGDDLREQLNEAARSAGLKHGRGRKGAPDMLANLMVRAGICSKKTALERIKLARRRDKQRIKQGPTDHR